MPYHRSVHILDTYEIDPRINLWYSTPKLINFIELDRVFLKIILFKIMPNFRGDSVFIYIYICVCVCVEVDEKIKSDIMKKSKKKLNNPNLMNLLRKPTLNVSVIITFFEILNWWKFLLKQRWILDEIAGEKKMCIKVLILSWIFFLKTLFFSPVILSNIHRFFNNLFYRLS